MRVKCTSGGVKSLWRTKSPRLTWMFWLPFLTLCSSAPCYCVSVLLEVCIVVYVLFDRLPFKSYLRYSVPKHWQFPSGQMAAHSLSLCMCHSAQRYNCMLRDWKDNHRPPPLSAGFSPSNLFFGLLSTVLAHLQLQVRAWQSFHQFMDEKDSHGHRKKGPETCHLAWKSLGSK